MCLIFTVSFIFCAYFAITVVLFPLLFFRRPSLPSFPTGGGRVEVAYLLYYTFRMFRRSRSDLLLDRELAVTKYTIITKLKLESWTKIISAN